MGSERGARLCDDYPHNAYPWRFLNLEIYCCLGSTLVSCFSVLQISTCYGILLRMLSDFWAICREGDESSFIGEEIKGGVSLSFACLVTSLSHAW